MPQESSLARKLGFGDAYFLVIGAVFGTGIFFTSGLMAADCPSPIYLLIAWVAGGAITLMGALTFAELGTLFPGAGGPYVYLRESYGPLAGFLYGWGFFWIVGCGGIAALGAGFAESLRPFLPGLFSPAARLALPLTGGSVGITAAQAVAVAAIAAVSVLNLRGVQTGARAQNALVIARVAGLGLFIGLGLFLALKAGWGPSSAAARAFHGGPVRWTGFGAAFLAVLWTYDGWYSVTCTAEEIRRPEKVLPVALGLGVLSLTVLYVLANIVYSMALPMEDMKGVVGVGEAASLRLLGPRAALFFAVLISVSALGCLSANVLFCARVPFAMARDGFFWKRLGAVHPRTRVPAAALGVQLIVSAALALTGRFQQLYEFVVFALTIFFAATAVSVIVFRRTRPGLPRPYRVPGYPAVPVLFALVNGAIFLVSAWTRPVQAAAAAGVLALGVPAYGIWKRRGGAS